jgi:hypothetical protein
MEKLNRAMGRVPRREVKRSTREASFQQPYDLFFVSLAVVVFA